MPNVLISDKLVALQAVSDLSGSRHRCGCPKTGAYARRSCATIIGRNTTRLAIRSATKVTKELLEVATKLKVVGRAGIGVDNVDLKSRHVARRDRDEHAAWQLDHHGRTCHCHDVRAGAGKFPEATASTKAGKWEKNRFMGTELTGKVLGLIGAGNIGSIVADRAQGLTHAGGGVRSRILSEKRALDMGVEKLELD